MEKLDLKKEKKLSEKQQKQIEKEAKRTESRKNKRSFEFSKIMMIIIVAVVGAIAIWSIIRYYQLVNLAIMYQSSVMPDASLPITCVSVILGTLLSYFLYQGGLKMSLNKNGLKIDQKTGIVSAIFQGDSESLILQDLSSEAAGIVTSDNDVAG